MGRIDANAFYTLFRYKCLLKFHAIACVRVIATELVNGSDVVSANIAHTSVLASASTRETPQCVRNHCYNNTALLLLSSTRHWHRHHIHITVENECRQCVLPI